VISVGSVSKEFRGNNDLPTFNKRLDFILPSFDYVSYTIDDHPVYKIDRGDSIAAAVITSITALLLSNGNVDVNNIRDQLTRLSQSYNDIEKFELLNPIIPPK
jgi:hypothetical protein